MNKETKIAKENVEGMQEIIDKDIPEPKEMYASYDELLFRSFAHKQTCQRWLEFLETMHYEKLCIAVSGSWFDKYTSKERELKRAIKLYEDAGI